MQENKVERDYITIDNFDSDALKYEVKQALGRTITSMKARCYAVISVVYYDEYTDEVTVQFRVMEPVKAVSSNTEDKLTPEEFTPELKAATDNFAEWLTGTAELIEFKTDELQILELFYSSLRRAGKVAVSTEVMHAIATMSVVLVDSFWQICLKSSQNKKMYTTTIHL